MKNRVSLNSEYWFQNSGPICLGCFSCTHREICGGISIKHEVGDCFAFCRCKANPNSPFVCPCNPERFVARVREIQGFGLENVGSGAYVKLRRLPFLIPILKNRSSRTKRLGVPAVCLDLRSVFSKRTGLPNFSSRKELADRFLFNDDARIVVSGVGKDHFIEPYWSVGREKNLAAHFANAKFDLVTTPNFSMFCDVPRTDDLYNMKRIAICWQELSATKVPSAIHLNGRTPQDWRRWSSFLKTHPEALGIAFEFRTGAASPSRSTWYRDRLVDLAQSVGRKMVLALRGGLSHLPELSRCYDVTFLSDTPLIKAWNHQKLFWKPGRQDEWHPARRTEVDELLAHNSSVYGSMINYLCDVSLRN